MLGRVRRVILIVAALLWCGAASGETLDEYFVCRFSWSPAVYTGPAGSYFRAGGKAQYGSPGRARVYGMENGWLLIGYETASGQYRLGYIDGEKALSRMYDAPEDAQVRMLSFAYESVTLTRNAELTDDPVMTKTPIDSLSRGQEVIFLATLGDAWGYVEVRTGATWKRGFVPLAALGMQAEQSGAPADGWADAWTDDWADGIPADDWSYDGSGQADGWADPWAYDQQDGTPADDWTYNGSDPADSWADPWTCDQQDGTSADDWTYNGSDPADSWADPWAYDQQDGTPADDWSHDGSDGDPSDNWTAAWPDGIPSDDWTFDGAGGDPAGARTDDRSYDGPDGFAADGRSGGAPADDRTADGTPAGWEPNGDAPEASAFPGVWAVANQRLAGRSGPSAASESAGIFYLQNQVVLVLARHYDAGAGVWWVKCRAERDGETCVFWTAVKRFYNPDWLLDQLPDE